ncbi:type VI secretion system protein VasD [Marinobacterium lutimaris]|uniref:Type VI secretion system protein VasD n=2 Tax=Marinobacterium lutimaris TaxID=568106 RepID=A0A1H5UGB4_9GAMM|nr:type VI secretion system protein VasD [Marinobacterium lutimaris]
MALFRNFAGFLLVATLLGCGVADRVGNRFSDSWVGELVGNEERVRVTVNSDEWLNPGASGEPLSVVVRIYQLSESGAFVSASPRQLWSGADLVLGHGLISEREITVLPGEQKVDVSALALQTQYVGVAAFFRNTGYYGDWHVVFDADELRKDGLLGASEGVRLHLAGDRIEVERGDNLLSLVSE